MNATQIADALEGEYLAVANGQKKPGKIDIEPMARAVQELRRLATLPSDSAQAPRRDRDARQLADWLLTDPECGGKLHFAGPLERDLLGLSRVRMENERGEAWTLTAGLKEGYLTTAERMANLRLAVKEEGEAAAQAEDQSAVSLALYKAVCADHERASAGLAEQGEVIQALQKALAYWMPKVFDERSAHDAYLLVGYQGEDEKGWGDEMRARLALHGDGECESCRGGKCTTGDRCVTLGCDSCTRCTNTGYLPDGNHCQWCAVAAPVAPAAAAHPDKLAQFEAWAKIHHYDLVRCSHEPYAAYRSDLTNAALAGWRGANGESSAPQAPSVPVELSGVKEALEGGDGFWRTCSGCHETEDGHDVGHYPFSDVLNCTLGGGCSECGGLGAVWDDTDYDDMAEFCERWTASAEQFEEWWHEGAHPFRNVGGTKDLQLTQEMARSIWNAARATAPQANDHCQQLLGVAYVVLGCLAANGVDIPARFLDAFSDPDSVENPLELLPCDFLPAQSVRAVVEGAALTDEQIEKGWHATFSTSNPYCPCNLKSFTKAVRWAEHAISAATKEGS